MASHIAMASNAANLHPGSSQTRFKSPGCKQARSAHLPAIKECQMSSDKYRNLQSRHGVEIQSSTLQNTNPAFNFCVPTSRNRRRATSQFACSRSGRPRAGFERTMRERRGSVDQDALNHPQTNTGKKRRNEAVLLGGARQRNVIEGGKMAGSKDLLHLEQPATALESRLRVCNSKNRSSFVPVGPSSVLGRVKEFLPALAAANTKLESDIRERGADKFDIEVLTQGESMPHVEMDLALGVADLQTPEAVAAAELAVKGCGSASVLTVEASCGGCEEEDSSSDDEDDDQVEKLEVENFVSKRKSSLIHEL